MPAKTSSKDTSEKAQKILAALKKEIAGAKIALAFKTPLELLIATILSAQCTDERVNKTTPELFKKYKTAKDYAAADIKELEKLISSINFFRNKAKSIKACALKLVSDFGGSVPKSVEELTTLPGVGRKTANVVLGSAYGIPALAVDTHVKKVTQRLGLTANDDPDKIEEDLCALIPEKLWTDATTLFILHGRKTCKAKNPLCEECAVTALCDYYKKA
ncbi:MAG: endonuclease III [Deltaproteobacteria bacterium]|nr:endonuclease III [Deltaproteobacteria bacterium]